MQTNDIAFGTHCVPSACREALYIDRVDEILRQLPKWREERLPPPRVSQSEVGTSQYFFDKLRLIYKRLLSMTKSA
jgi:hypothetical protein